MNHMLYTPFILRHVVVDGSRDPADAFRRRMHGPYRDSVKLPREERQIYMYEQRV